MKILEKLSRFCFYLFVFWVPFSVSALIYAPDYFQIGFYNPFLVHFIYIADVFFLFAVIFYFVALVFELEKSVPKISHLANFKLSFFVLLYVFAYLISLIFSVDLNNSSFYFLRAIQFFLFYLFLSSGFLSFKVILRIFLISVSFQAVLGLLQFIIQNDLGLQVLGEPVLDSTMKSVAKIDIFGQTFLRSYGTFAHPNVFGAYIVLSIFALFYLRPKGDLKFVSIFLLLSFALLTTFSRSAVLAAFVGMALSKYRMPLFLTMVSVIFLLIFLIAPLSTIPERLIAYLPSLNIFLENIFGIGAGNFTLLLPDYVTLRLDPWQIQPIHNVFLLTLVELGFLGFLSLLSILYFKFKDLVFTKSSFRIFEVAGLAALVIFSLSDHYLSSLYQGQFLFWLIIASDSH